MTNLCFGIPNCCCPWYWAFGRRSWTDFAWRRSVAGASTSQRAANCAGVPSCAASETMHCVASPPLDRWSCHWDCLLVIYWSIVDSIDWFNWDVALTAADHIRQIRLDALVGEVAVPLRWDFTVQRVQSLGIGHQHGASLLGNHIVAVLLLLLCQMTIGQASIQLVVIAARPWSTASPPGED